MTRVGEELKSFVTMENMCKIRSVGLRVKRELLERMVVPTVTFVGKLRV